MYTKMVFRISHKMPQYCLDYQHNSSDYFTEYHSIAASHTVRFVVFGKHYKLNQSINNLLTVKCNEIEHCVRMNNTRISTTTITNTGVH